MDTTPLRFFGMLLRDQWTKTPIYPETDHFTGKTIIVTGGNTGLGKEAARHLVRLGASKVIIACRTTSKGEDAKRDIEQSESCAPGTLEVWELDLSSYASVKAFAKRCHTLERLDVLLENAGVLTYDFALTEDNETTITTNVVSTFLLALLCLPKMKETARTHDTSPRISIVNSEVHFLSNLTLERESANIFDYMNAEATANMSDRYNASKTLQLLAVFGMVRAAMQPVEGYPVIVNAVNPGLCRTSLMSGMGSEVIKLLMNARTAEVGSRTLVAGAAAGRESHGKYMSCCAVADPSSFVSSEEGKEAAVRVWKELGERLEKIEPGVLGNL